MAKNGNNEAPKYTNPDTPMEILTTHILEIEKLAPKEQISEPLKTLITKAARLAEGLDPYLEEITTPESDILKELAQRSDDAPWDKLHQDGKTMFRLPKECLTGHVEGQFMKTLVALTGAKSVLEIGMFTGYATLAMAEALPPEGSIVTLEIEPYLKEFFTSTLNKSPHRGKVDIRIGPAKDSLVTLATEKRTFDLVFIDADKTGYLGYYKTLMDEKLLSETGAICIDNAMYRGEVYLEGRGENGQALKDFNLFVKDDPRTEQVLLPLRDGVMIIRHKKN